MTSITNPARHLGRWWRKHPLRLGMSAFALSGVLVPTLAGGASAAAAAAHVRGPAPARQVPVQVHVVAPHHIPVTPAVAWVQPPVTWPAAGSGLASVPAPRPAVVGATSRPSAPELEPQTARAVQAGSLPVYVAPAPGDAAPAVVDVRMLDHSSAHAAGVSGVIFTVDKAGASAEAANLRVHLDYSSFAFAAGGDYAGRLRLVLLPACAATTPRIAACRKQTPINFSNDVTAFDLAAPLTMPGGAAGTRAFVLAATTGPDGAGGNFAASSISDAGTWQAGGSSGAFTYSYPLTLPPVPGNLAPQVVLSYNSQTVDGLTSSTNNQASWIGDGWNYSPGYVERTYQPCQTSSDKSDLCWSSNDNLTLSFNGQNTTLVYDSTSKTWHAEADDNERVSYVVGTGSNGTHDDDYWVITDADGTSYYFGRNELPGYAAGNPTTDSAWTVPVYATQSGQPCYSATFSLSHCAQAWRWNLDYVVDRHGNAIAYFYDTETNYFGADGAATATAGYVRSGALSAIYYGLRDGQADPTTTEAAEVSFTTVATRSDVPTDLSCTSGAACDVHAPTFWTKYQLTTISTKSLVGTTMEPADSYALTQTFAATGDGSTTPPLWLSGITRTGEDGSPHISLPPVKFDPGPSGLANRVLTPADVNGGYSDLARDRIESVTTETGAVVSVSYDTPPSSCTSGNFPAPDDNTTLCYPDQWTPPGASSPMNDWFNKYVVTAVTQSNTAGGATPVVTSYCYGTSPDCLNSGAWHYDDDSMVRADQRTWDEWRGFSTVRTEVGESPDPVTESQDTYFQGMDGDYQSDGSTSSVSLTDAHGDSVTDSDQFAGQPFEHVVYDAAGGAVVSDSVTIPWSSGPTATQPQPSPLPDLTAHMAGTAATKVFIALAGGGWREADNTYTYDAYGRVTSDSSVPDTTDPSEDTCTDTTYATNTTNWIFDLSSRVVVTSVPCTTTPSFPADAVSDTLYFYDGATSLASDVPTAGNLTATDLATSYNGSSPVYTVESKMGFDEYGRATSSTNADDDTTSFAYTPATGAEPTAVTTTDPMKLTSTTYYDAVRESPVKTTSAAGWVTTQTYDALGRLTAYWLPGHVQGTDPADTKYSYTVTQTGPSIVTTDDITPSGTYTATEQLYDSLGRSIETQTETADGNRTVSDTYYDSDGLPYKTSSPYYTTGAPSGSIVAAPDDQVPSQTGLFYDGDGRVVRDVSYTFASEEWETDTTYGGDYTTVSPPAGGTPTTTFTNGEGETSALYDYHAGVPVDPSDPSSDYDKTTYTYTPTQQLSTTTDNAGDTWHYGYNLAGDQTSVSTPDSGTTTDTYDPAGQLLTTTDARNDQTSFTYDADGRKTADYDTTGGVAETSADKVTSWTYDTLAKGQPTSSTSYVGGTTGTAYTSGVLGYNGYGLPTGTFTSISSGPLAGAYKQGLGYSPYGDLLADYYDYAVAGLPAEQVNIGYDNTSDPVTVGSSLWSYVSNLSYTELGQPQKYSFGPTSAPAWMLDTYDPATNRLSGSMVQVGTTPSTVDDTTYNYDASGNVLAERDTPADGPTQVQCFQYDYLGRLSQAWAQGTAPCAGTASQSVESGAAAPYWNSYSYDSLDNLSSETETPAVGASTTYTNSFPTPGAGVVQPHAVQSQSVNGSPTTTYSYDASGNTTQIASSASTQTLAWNDAGELSSVTTTGTGAGKTTYVYDAAGNLLVQTDGSTSTLYLSDEQIVAGPGGVSGTRYYSIGSTTVAARTSTGTVDYLTGDAQGTDSLAIDASSLAVTRRYFDPNGEPIGAAPASWPGNRGFVGGTTDAATDLTNLGAREYSPSTATFVNTDLLTNPYDPQDLNPYAYASDNPTTLSDPTGLMFCDGGGYCGGGCDGTVCTAGSIATPGGGVIPPTPAMLGDNVPSNLTGHAAFELQNAGMQAYYGQLDAAAAAEQAQQAAALATIARNAAAAKQAEQQSSCSFLSWCGFTHAASDVYHAVTSKTVLDAVSTVASVAAAGAAFVPVVGTAVSVGLGVIATGADVLNAVVNHQSWGVVALDVVALVPGVAELRFAKEAEAFDDVAKGMSGYGRYTPPGILGASGARAATVAQSRIYETCARNWNLIGKVGGVLMGMSSAYHFDQDYGR